MLCMSSIILRATWPTILLSRENEAASNINVSQQYFAAGISEKVGSRSTLCNVWNSKNKNKDDALSFDWLWIVIAAGEGALNTVLHGEASLQGLTP